MLSRRAVSELLDFSERNPATVRFFQHVWIPDEIFIPTVLRNSASREHIIDESLWYIDWPPGGVKHPRVLRSSDTPALVAAAGRPSSVGGYARAKLFARKFDADIDDAILDALDEHAGVRQPVRQRATAD
jgi:hypothetical protein